MKSILLYSLFVVVCSLGCGGSGAPKTVKVSGTVMFDGLPLSEGTVTFMSMADKETMSRPAIGVLSKEGMYTLSTFAPGDGAMVGEYQVVIVSEAGIPSPEEIAEKGAKITSAIPSGYNNPTTSGLRAKVEGDEPMTLNFELKTGAVPDTLPNQNKRPKVDQFGT